MMMRETSRPRQELITFALIYVLCTAPPLLIGGILRVILPCPCAVVMHFQAADGVLDSYCCGAEYY